MQAEEQELVTTPLVVAELDYLVFRQGGRAPRPAERALLKSHTDSRGARYQR
jgi:hypothetical protein